MPELHLQRRAGTPAWAWPLGALVAAVLIWWIAMAAMPKRAAGTAAPQERVAGERQVLVGETGDTTLPISAIVAEPEQHLGQTVTGTAVVVEVPSEAGLWLEADGRRMFAVIDGATPEIRRLEAGQVVRLSGEVADESRVSEIPGITALRPDTRALLEDQQAFLHVDAERIEVLGPSLTGQPETGE